MTLKVRLPRTNPNVYSMSPIKLCTLSAVVLQSKHCSRSSWHHLKSACQRPSCGAVRHVLTRF